MTVRPDQHNNPFYGGYITVDLNWRITSCNRTAAKILQHTEHYLTGRDCREIFCADKRFQVLCDHLKGIAGACCSTSIQHSLPTSTAGDNTIPITVQLVTLPGADGSVLGTLISFSELSTPLAASRLALNSIAEGVFTVDHHCTITSFNSAAEKITGWAEAEVLGRPCRDIFRTPICRTDCTMARSIKDRTQVVKRSVYITSREGRTIPVQICAAPLVDLDGQVIGGVETFRDITNSLQNDIVLDAVADGVFTVNERGEITSFNRAAETITGWQQGEVLGKSCAEVLLSSTSTSSCALAACMREKKSIIDREIFIIGKDGYSIPVSVSAAPFLDPQGNVLGGVESFRDNTNRLQTALILDSIADGVFTVDRNWRITSFNMAAEIITGWNREKAIGQFCSDVFHSSICGKNCAIAESLYTGKPVSGRTITIQDYKDNCTSVSISAAPLLDLEGNVVGGVETFRDLSVEISLRQQLMKNFTFDAIISKSPSMQRLFQILPDISQSESNVLILGESGTGKELIARAIFNASARSDQPFVIVNCGALPETLLESELFGYKAGAFTDAKKTDQDVLRQRKAAHFFSMKSGIFPSPYRSSCSGFSSIKCMNHSVAIRP